MAWDNTDCILALAPAAWARGNAPADFNTGVMPSYPAGAYQPCTLTFMDVGYGFVNPDLKFDEANDAINCNDVLELNSVSKFTIEFIMNQDTLDQLEIICIKFNMALSSIIIQTKADGEMYFSINNKSGHFNYSTKISAGVDAHVAMVFDGTLAGDANRLKVFANGEQITLAFVGVIPATTANLGGISFLVGNTVNAIGGKIKWFAIYSDALTSARIITNYGLGADMGSIGVNIGGSMSLTSLNGNPYQLHAIVTGVAAAPELERLFEQLKPAWTQFDYVYIP